jgi:subtilisin
LASAIPTFGDLPDTIREVRLDLSATPRSPEPTDNELVQAVRGGDSIVVIGFKPLGVRLTSETGIIPAMSRAMALDFRAQVEAMGATLIHTMMTSSAIVVRIRPELAPALRRLPFVNYLAPTVHLRTTQSYPPQDTSWGARLIGAPYVWQNYSNAGNWAWITLLDSGVDSLHASSGSLDGPENLLELRYIEGWTDNAPYQDPTHPETAHGSMTAGVLSSRANAYGWIGIAYNPYGFTSVRVCKPVLYYGNWVNSCPLWAIESALDWTAANGHARQIVNMSIGGCGFSQSELTAFQEFIQRSLDAGNLLIASAGNYPDACGAQNQVLYPAKFPGVVAVSGTLANDAFAAPGDPANPCVFNGIAYGSRYGPEVDLSAPFHIPGQMQVNGTYGGLACGTSFSAPVVSAVAAMTWTRYPSYTASQVRARLLATAVPLGDPNHFGAGRVYAPNAVYPPPEPPPPPTLTLAIDGPRTVPADYSVCAYFGRAIDGTPPYEFSWYVDNNFVTTGEWLDWGGPTAFAIHLHASDALGRHGDYWANVGVDPNLHSCDGP